MYRKQVTTAYAYAFQLLRYQARDTVEMLVWNSRDGEIPSRFDFDGREYRFKRGLNERTSIIPERADLVIVSYTREQWTEACRASWEACCERDPKYIERTPTLKDFMRIAPFEHGLWRIVTRHQYLHETHEWQGRLGR